MSKVEMMATLENMQYCREHGIRAVMLDVTTGETFSADPGDYWYLRPDEVHRGTDAPCVLARMIPATAEPILWNYGE